MGKQAELMPIPLYTSLGASLVRHELRSGVRTGRAAPVRSDANARMGDRRSNLDELHVHLDGISADWFRRLGPRLRAQAALAKCLGRFT